MIARFNLTEFDQAKDLVNAMTNLHHEEISTHQTNGLTESFLISYFVCRLKNEIQMDIHMFYPRMIVTAIGLTHLQEKKLWARHH